MRSFLRRRRVPAVAILILGLWAGPAVGTSAEELSPDQWLSNPPQYASDSFVPEIRGKASGFFHVEKQGDAWWAQPLSLRTRWLLVNKVLVFPVSATPPRKEAGVRDGEMENGESGKERGR